MKRFLWFPIALLLAFLSWGAFVPVEAAVGQPLASAPSLITPFQTPITPTLPTGADADRGLITFANRCATCHGDLGLGDGPMAAQALQPPTAVGAAEYLATADPALMFSTIQTGNLGRGMPGFGAEQNSNPLTDAQIWDVIAAIYELPALSQPLSTAVVTGAVRNATLDEVVGTGTAILQAFTLEFDEALRLEQPLTAEGGFRFELTNVPPQWIYRVVVPTTGLEFSSDFGRLSAATPELDLPVTTYNTTTDAAVVAISQLDVILEFTGTTVRVNELYRFDNRSDTVYVGPTGDFTQGAVQINLPPEAQNVTFLRALGGGATDFAPADEEIQATAAGLWTANLPLGLGAGAMRLVARYELPYGRGTTISHPLPYPVDLTTVLLPAESVRLEDEAGLWQPTTGQSDLFVRYQRPPLASGEPLLITVAGFPTTITDAEGNLIPNRDPQQELWWGTAVFLAALAAVGLSIYRWRTATPPIAEQDALLQAIAALDDAYAQQAIGRRPYERRRAELKEQLLNLWEE